MNPIFQMAIASTLALKRTCPKCGRGQIVPQSKIKQTVKCKFCGADVPPPRK